MPEVIWHGYCKFCKAPLDPLFIGETQQEINILSKIDMSNLDNNDSIYKFVGLNAYKVCEACFKNIKEHKSTRRIMKRELGQRYPMYHKSLTQSELKEWFFSLKKFF